MARSTAVAWGALLIATSTWACTSGSAPGPSLLSSTPGHGETHVAVASSVTLEFSGPLDPATVSSDTIRLVFRNETFPEDVPATVTYDAASETVTIDPRAALFHGFGYRVELSGLRGARGERVDHATFRFRTAVNPVLRSEFYTETGLHSYQVRESRDDGTGGRSISYSGAGTDGVWMTADDVVSRYTDDDNDEDGKPVHTAAFDAAGVDGVWFTADDRLAQATTWSYDAAGIPLRRVEVSDWGPDGQPYTADDRVTTYEQATLLGGRWARLELYVAPSFDGKWFTPDDAIGWCSEFVYDDAGFPARVLEFGNAECGDPLAIVRIQTYLFDAGGMRLRWAPRVDGPGDDGVWNTGDDLVSTYSRYEYDAVGRLVGITGHSAQGPDALWFTQDDPATSRNAITYDASGHRTRAESHFPGADGVWSTADDHVSVVTTYDPSR